jgi:hypothetical protein
MTFLSGGIRQHTSKEMQQESTTFNNGLKKVVMQVIDRC